jgi:hypothetical protein
MKKIFTITIAAIVLAIIFTATMMVFVGGSEQEEDSRAVRKPTEGIISLESVDIGSIASGFTLEEIGAMSPGYFEYLRVKASEMRNVDSNTEAVIGTYFNGFNLEEIGAMYPGYLEYLYFKASMVPRVDSNPAKVIVGPDLSGFTLEEIGAMYPGYLEYLYLNGKQ